MRVLVIGGSGFIGRFVLDELVGAGHDVTVFHRGRRPVAKSVEEILGDRRHLADHAAALRRLAADVVLDMILSSERQARELMDLLSGAARRVVALSSIDVYRACGVLHGTEPGPLEPVPLAEDSPVRAQPAYSPESLKMLQGIYGWVDSDYDKVPVERVILSRAALPGTVLRLPMVYGPGDPLHRFYPVVKRIDDGRPAIFLEETMAQWRGCRGYVGNVAAAIVLAVTSGRAAGRVYNVAEPQNFSELDWTRKICDVAGWPGKVQVVPRERCPKHLIMPGDFRQHWAAESSRIRRELGYREPVSIEAGIRSTLEWERANPPSNWPFGQFDYAAEDLCSSVSIRG